MSFASIEDAIEDIRAGRMVVVCDDEDRENEGDLTLAAQFATPEAINFMAKYGRGLICLSLTVSGLGDDWLQVSLIPETLERTILGAADTGQTVNLEVDVLAKYVERLVASR